MQVSTSPIASVSPCLHGFQAAVARNRKVARLYSSSLFLGWTSSNWFCHVFGLSCGAVFFVFLLIECMPAFLCLKAARKVVRRCGVCRLDGHMAPRCPIKYRSNFKCGCKKRSCGRCSAACDVCEEVRHETDNVDFLSQGGAPLAGRALHLRWALCKRACSRNCVRSFPPYASRLTRPAGTISRFPK